MAWHQIDGRLFCSSVRAARPRRVLFNGASEPFRSEIRSPADSKDSSKSSSTHTIGRTRPDRTCRTVLDDRTGRDAADPVQARQFVSDPMDSVRKTLRTPPHAARILVVEGCAPFRWITSEDVSMTSRVRDLRAADRLKALQQGRRSQAGLICARCQLAESPGCEVVARGKGRCV
jgi:hypothetical protein